MAITASEARKNLFPLIEQVNNDRAPVEITSKNGRAVLMSSGRLGSLAGDGIPLPHAGERAATTGCRRCPGQGPRGPIGT